MKNKAWKRLLSLVLAAGMFFGAPQAAAAQGTLHVQPQLGNPSLTDVTEKEEAAFERGLFAEIKGNASEETLAVQAQKKAAALVSLYGVNSVQYAVMKDGKLVLSDTYGYTDREKKQKADENTMYGIASISKMFTTTAMMQLVEAGKVSLDAPVTTYLPEFVMADERYKDITVRMLLNHSSGLMGSTLRNAILYADNDTWYHDHLLAELKKQRLKADPGAYSVYCNDGFSLAELVIERVSGQTFTDYVAHNITGQLGLSHTKTPLDTFDTGLLAGTYLDKTGEKMPQESFNCIGTGGMYSTAKDLCTFGQTFTAAANGLLAKTSTDAMAQNEAAKGFWTDEASGFMDFGLGWDGVSAYPFDAYGIQELHKGGDSYFYHGELMVLPEKNVTVAVLSSGGNSTYDAIFGQFLALGYLEQEEGLVKKELQTKYTIEKAQVPQQFKAYDGYYSAMSQTYHVSLKDDYMELYVVGAKEQKMKFSYTKEGLFVHGTGLQCIKPVTVDGKTYLVSGTYSTLPGIGTMYMWNYIAQKNEPNPVSTGVKKAWQKRNGKNYFYISEKYTSAVYSLGPFSPISYEKETPEYFYTMKIVDADSSKSFLQIPMNAGRDCKDYTFRTINGREYMFAEGIRAIAEDALSGLPSKKSYRLSVSAKSGSARWFKIGSRTAGRTITVKTPKHGAFMVYDKNGSCKNNSYLTGKKSVKLPKGGYIVFAGDKGVTFNVRIK